MRYNFNIQDEGVSSHNFIYLNIFNESHTRQVFFCNCSLSKQLTCSLLTTYCIYLHIIFSSEQLCTAIQGLCLIVFFFMLIFKINITLFTNFLIPNTFLNYLACRQQFGKNYFSFRPIFQSPDPPAPQTFR